MLNSTAANLQPSFFFTRQTSILIRLLLMSAYLFVSLAVFCQHLTKPENRSARGLFSRQNHSLKFTIFSSKATNELNATSAFYSYLVEKKASTNLIKADSADRDGDGIVDSLDKCPDEKGVIQYDGCPVPDTDHDGIADDSDQCPTIAGTIKHNGCPAGDRDGDKINDDEDKCPDQPGVARLDGCLVKDTDGDGVDDDNDKCITIAGTRTNSGCPEVKAASSTVKGKQKTNRKRL